MTPVINAASDVPSSPQPFTQVLGKDGGLLLTIDNAFPDPEELVALAEEAFFVRAGAVYPGVRSPVPARYINTFQTRIAPLIEAAFGAAVSPKVDAPSFSIVTTPPAQLAVNQRTPHTDANAGNALAFIHYLCNPAHGGTAFYRHKSTGFERVTEERAAKYNAIVAKDLAARQHDGECTFVAANDAHFERIDVAENRFNRMLVYHGNSLHSGDIRTPDRLSASAREGRLTVTGFLSLEQ